MVKVSYQQKPYRRALMETYGARCIASPSWKPTSAAQYWRKMPDSTGSLGIAISEAVEVAATHDDTKYALGSVLNHVLLHQTVGRSRKPMKQMEWPGDDPDIIIAAPAAARISQASLFPFLVRNCAAEATPHRCHRAGGVPFAHRPPMQRLHDCQDLTPARLSFCPVHPAIPWLAISTGLVQQNVIQHRTQCIFGVVVGGGDFNGFRDGRCPGCRCCPGIFASNCSPNVGSIEGLAMQRAP